MARTSPYPPYDLEEALQITKTIWKHNSGNPMRRLTIFDVLKKSPSSGTSRLLITASSGYGLTQGGYQAEFIQLTDRGRAIVEKNDAKSKIDAVLSIEIFNSFFESYRNASVPSDIAAKDFLKSNGIPEKRLHNCLEILISSGEQVGLIQEISGVKRVVSPDFALEKLQKFEVRHEKISTDSMKEKTKESEGHVPKGKESTTAYLSQQPSIHIDIQIHISADAKPEQIDQIFASMAKHLYNRSSG